MFHGFGKEVFSFFLDLRFHNSKAFMDENRERYYRDVRDPFYAFIAAMAPTMLEIDPDMEVRPNKCLSRINRDIRFSKDKSPYRDHLWVAFRSSCAGKDGVPFFWFELRPESVTWGVGIWGESREIMDAMRRKMAARPDDYLRILPVLQERGFALCGREWKKISPPDGLPEALIPWYLKREIYAEKQGASLLSVGSPDLIDRISRDFRVLAPLYQIFRGCVEDAMNHLDEQGGNV